MVNKTDAERVKNAMVIMDRGAKVTWASIENIFARYPLSDGEHQSINLQTTNSRFGTMRMLAGFMESDTPPDQVGFSHSSHNAMREAMKLRIDAIPLEYYKPKKIEVPMYPTYGIYTMVEVEYTEDGSALLSMECYNDGSEDGEEVWVTVATLPLPLYLEGIRSVIVNVIEDHWGNPERPTDTFHDKCESPRHDSGHTHDTPMDQFLVAVRGVCLECADAMKRMEAAVPQTQYTYIDGTTWLAPGEHLDKPRFNPVADLNASIAYVKNSYGAAPKPGTRATALERYKEELKEKMKEAKPVWSSDGSLPAGASLVGAFLDEAMPPDSAVFIPDYDKNTLAMNRAARRRAERQMKMEKRK